MKVLNNRKCIVTGKSQSRDNLIRVVKLKNGHFEVNSFSKGRGSYVSKDIDLFEKINNRKLLHRSFKSKVPQKVYDDLKKVLEEE